MKNTELAFCKFSKYPILKSIRVKFSRYKQKSMNVRVSFDTLILIYIKKPRILCSVLLVLSYCGRWDLNPHDRIDHKILSLARLPVPTLPHSEIFFEMMRKMGLEPTRSH